MYLFQFCTCFNCINKISRRKVPFRPAHETVTDTDRHLPVVILTQLILLMMSTELLETCRELK